MQVNLISNTMSPVVAASEDDGGYATLLESGEVNVIDNDAIGVIIIGDKPNVFDNLLSGAKIIAQPVIDVMHRIVGQRPRPDTGVKQALNVTVENMGTEGIRVLLGDGTTEYTVAPGKQYDAKAVGFIELRQLGMGTQSNDPNAPENKTTP